MCDIFLPKSQLMKVFKKYFVSLREKSSEFFIGIEHLCEYKQLIFNATYSSFRSILFIQYVIRGVEQCNNFKVERFSISNGRRFFNKQEVFREWRCIGRCKHCWHGLFLFSQFILTLKKICLSSAQLIKYIYIYI